MNSLLHVPKSDLPRVLTSIDSVLDDGGLFYMGVYGGEDFEVITFRQYNVQRGRSFKFQSILMRKRGGHD